jgi:hypothetical protein
MNKLYLGTVKLLSQDLAKLEPIYQQTACLGAEEREIICVLTAYADLIRTRKPDKAKRIKEVIIPFIEKIGVGKWQRFELTDLGLRVATRNVTEAEATLDTVDEATIFAADNNPE